ncbi:NAD-dependent epimerase/dehydratase family protein [Ornithinicoccus halotolerans]|uniref:NAD-dependent epimerase/dehydratase family protein n=1 Tax=Ornithinicoccus halotolerans TaxID=1748220 RepID=UPI001E2AA3BD|nr:NAD-dependent epimerase/dehydratase family protein [Ornithinicoccus halotolerans]
MKTAFRRDGHHGWHDERVAAAAEEDQVRVLVLGGSHFVGRAVVAEARRRGDEVTTLNRGLSATGDSDGPTIRVDRRDVTALQAALADREWDAVVDTWSDEPAVVAASARVLADRAQHYGYVSSRSVHRWPLAPGADETAPVVDGDPDSEDGSDYAAAKRGGELAVLRHFAGRALLPRPGIILGPYEDVGRLPWWLGRMSTGGRVLAPGPPELPLQYVDARDLAGWMLDAARRRLTGAFNTVSHRGHATMRQLLVACNQVTGNRAELVWRSAEAVQAAGIAPWTELPIWVPAGTELEGLHAGDVSAAHAEGLRCRPVEETVADTWHWLQTEGVPPGRPGRPPLGVDAEAERRALAQPD